MAPKPLAASLLLLALTLPYTTRAEDAKPCTGRNGGKYFDLNGLQNPKDYSIKTPNGHELILSPCKAVSHETWGLKMTDEEIARVAGFTRREHGDFSIGQLNTTLSFSARSGYPHLTYSAGSRCVDGTGNRMDNMRGSTEIEFVCDPSAGNGTPRLIAQLPPGEDEQGCAWVFEWRTAAACATSEGWSFGGVVWFLFSTTLILLGAYLAIGTLYNYFALNLRGADLIPKFSITSAVYHTHEAFDIVREGWSTSGPRRGRFGLRDSGTLNAGPAGFSRGRSFGARDEEGGSVEDDEQHTPTNKSFAPNSFVRTRKEPTALNPASHHSQQNPNSISAPPAPPVLNAQNVSASPMPTAQGLNPASHQAQLMSPPLPRTDSGLGSSNSGPPPIARTNTGGGGLNPASHQAQVLSGMPVAHLSRSPAPQGQGPTSRLVGASGLQPLTPGRERFALGEEDVSGDEEDEGEGAYLDAGAGGGAVKL